MASSFANKLADAASKEFFWGCELSKDKPTVSWTFEEEEDDTDFLQHTLFLKHAILGKLEKAEEKNVIEIETKNFAGELIKQPIICLTGGKVDMVPLDLSFGHEIPVTFRLIEGTGPVYLSAQHLVEFPQEVDEGDGDYTETEEELEETEEETEETEGTEGTEEESATEKKTKKKRGRKDTTEEDTDEGDEEMETSEEENTEDTDDKEETEDTEEDSPKKKVKSAKRGRPVTAAKLKKNLAAKTKRRKVDVK